MPGERGSVPFEGEGGSWTAAGVGAAVCAEELMLECASLMKAWKEELNEVTFVISSSEDKSSGSSLWRSLKRELRHILGQGLKTGKRMGEGVKWEFACKGGE